MKTIRKTFTFGIALIASAFSAFGQYTVLVDDSSNIIFPTNLSGIPASGLTGTVPTNTLSGLLSGLSTGNGTGVTNETTEVVGLMSDPLLTYTTLQTRGTDVSTRAGPVSTYTSWFEGMGVVTGAFNTVRFAITNWTTNKPTVMRAVVRLQLYEWPFGSTATGVTNPTTWPIVADSGLVPVSLTSNTKETAAIFLGSEVNTTSNLLLQISANGYWMPYASSGTYDFNTNGVATCAYSATGTTNPSAVTTLTTTPRYRFQHEVGNTNLLTDYTLTALSSNKIESIARALDSSSQDVEVQLSALYGVQGDQLNVYYRNVVRANNLPALTMDVACSAGAQYQNFYRLTSAVNTNITYPWSLAVKYGTNTIDSWSGSLHVSANTNGLGVSRSVCIIGDSTTAGGQVITELTSRGGTNGFLLTGVGTKGSDTNKHEGTSGASVSSFYSGASYHATPMTNLSGAFDFNYYLTNNALTLASNDWVIINLGINDMFAAVTDTDAYQRITNAARMLTEMVTNVQFSVPGIRVAVTQTIGPAASQDAFGDDYGTLYTRWSRYVRNRFMWNEYFGTNGVAGATILPLNYCVDTVNNFTGALVAVNSRNTNTVWMQNNALHPDTSGYYQIADAYYAFLKWFEQ